MIAMDPRTIFIVSSGLYFLLAGALVLFSASLPKQRGGASWAAGASCLALSFLLLLFRGVLPDYLSVVAGNQGMLISACLASHGLARQVYQHPPLTFYLTVCLANLAGFIYFCYVSPSFSARGVILMASMMTVVLQMTWCLLSQFRQANGSSPFLLLCSLLAFIPVGLFRVTYYVSSPGESLMQGHEKNAASLIFFSLNILALGYGLMSLAGSSVARQRDEANQKPLQANTQLLKALDNVKTLSGMVPIRATGSRIRDDQGYWRPIVNNPTKITGSDPAHGIRPDCGQERLDKMSRPFDKREE